MSLFASKRHFPQSGVMSQEIISVFGQEILHQSLKTPFEETAQQQGKVSVSSEITGINGQVLVSAGTFWIYLEKAVWREL